MAEIRALCRLAAFATSLAPQRTFEEDQCANSPQEISHNLVGKVVGKRPSLSYLSFLIRYLWANFAFLPRLLTSRADERYCFRCLPREGEINRRISGEWADAGPPGGRRLGEGRNVSGHRVTDLCPVLHSARVRCLSGDRILSGPRRGHRLFRERKRKLFCGSQRWM